MKLKFTCKIIAILLMLLGQAYAGKLVIVGGALSNKNESVYKGFINALPSLNSRIAIIPVASSKPVATAEKFREDLISYGVKADNISVYPLAFVDDPTTAEDESAWRLNANNKILLEQFKDVDGFWFVGGDQMRILDTLRLGDEKTSLLLELINNKLDKNAVVGGTSAGAAMMSNPMIAAGDSFSSLTNEPENSYYGTEAQDRGNLYLYQGLGFFPYGMVDQHFDRKGRLGRLIKTLAITTHFYGYAVDENTAMLVDNKKEEILVLGSGSVTLVDAKNAQFTSKPFSAKNIIISVIPEGTRFNLKTREYHLADNMQSVIGHEYESGVPHQGAGLSMGNGRLDQFLGHDLLDNSSSKEIRKYHFDEAGKGYIFRYLQADTSRGYWAEHEGSQERYALINVVLDVLPINIKIMPVSE